MTGINHAITGALIATAVTNPVLMVPIAFVSHLALDSLPHFGEVHGFRKKLTKSVWLIDGLLLVALAIWFGGNAQWLALLGAVVAISPDFVWIYRLMVEEKFGKYPPTPLSGFNKFHAGIQKFESRKGLLVDIIWFLAGSYLLWSAVS